MKKLTNSIIQAESRKRQGRGKVLTEPCRKIILLQRQSVLPNILLLVNKWKDPHDHWFSPEPAFQLNPDNKLVIINANSKNKYYQSRRTNIHHS